MIKNLISKVKTKAQSVKRRAERKAIATICNVKAEGYVDTGVKVLIAVVVGALVLALLYGLFKTTIMATVTTKVAGLFSYTGTT